MFSFKNNELLLGFLALLILVVFFIYSLSSKQRIKKRLGDNTFINSLIQDYSPFFYQFRFYIALLFLSLIIISAANPRRESKFESDSIKSIDIIIAVDASNSMLCYDVSPSRLEASKNIIDNLLNEFSNDRIGVISFAGNPFLQLPVTTDIDAAKMYIGSISTDAVPEQGTSIGKALKLCNSSLILPENRAKAIILISDGEDHDPTALDEANQLAKQGITLFTIGIGTVQGSKIIDKETAGFKKDENGKTIISSLNEPLLKEIADITKGKYFSITDLKSNTRILLDEINKLEKKSLPNRGNSGYISYYWVFLAAAILLLVFEIFIPEIKRRSTSLL